MDRVTTVAVRVERRLQCPTCGERYTGTFTLQELAYLVEIPRAQLGPDSGMVYLAPRPCPTCIAQGEAPSCTWRPATIAQHHKMPTRRQIP